MRPDSPQIMGIVNINDDSFSGDGSLDPDIAIAQSLAMQAAGADIIDLGAESARTNRDPISIRRRDPAPKTSHQRPRSCPGTTANLREHLAPGSRRRSPTHGHPPAQRHRRTPR